jgi:hypothetical protein
MKARRWDAALLIRELELPVADARACLGHVRQFVDRILSSAEVIDGNLR